MGGQSGVPLDTLKAFIVGRNPRRTLVRIVILLITSVVVFKFVLVPIRVEGISMQPTYREHKVNFVNRLAYKVGQPRRGDVVAIRLAGPHIMFMKRIIALPGEEIGFHGGVCYINGQPLEEPYVKYPCNWEMEEERLGADEYYVVGDNRSMNRLDHEQGIATRERLVGKVLL